MGIFDKLSNMDPAEMTNYATYGPILGKTINNMNQKMEQIKKRPKPGRLCNQVCQVNDNRCENCLAMQNQFSINMQELEQMEQMSDNPEMMKSKKITECPVCGAPIERWNNCCVYCDSPYPEGSITFDFPTQKSEQERVILEKAVVVYTIFVNLRKMQYEYNKEYAKETVPKLLRGFSGYIQKQTVNYLEMDAQQLKQGAQQNNETLSGYINGVIEERYKTMGIVNLEKKQEQMEKIHQQHQQYLERNREILAERDAKLKKTSEERYQLMLSRAERSAPTYLAGSSSSSSCCGNCIYFIPGDNKCLNNKFRYPSGASDYCGDFRRK